MFSTFPKNLDFRHYNKDGTMDQFNRKRPHGGMTKNQAKKQKFNENILSEAPQGNFPCQSKAKSLLFLKILILRSILNDREVFSLKMLYVSFALRLMKQFNFEFLGRLQLKLDHPYQCIILSKLIAPPTLFWGARK